MLKFNCCHAKGLLSDQEHLLRGITRGLERECLRVDHTGQLAQTPHPCALGSKLTHPWITTDYAEALLEFITPPSPDPDFPLAFLTDLHRFAAQNIGGESLWAGSMPCKIGNDADIAIADYGSSNEARFKMVYRQGLGMRYGRAMQTIAGVHYNWSLPDGFWRALHQCCPGEGSLQDQINAHYFGLIRNFLRFGWLVPYLFGASPALCQSFLQGRLSDLKQLGPGTLYGQYATSLRMSNLGYQNHAQDKLAISFNSLAEYVAALETAMRTPDPFYSALGVRDDSHWQQLSANLLQTEAEFYAPMRPKRISGERSALALKTHGVQYIEMRLFDVNPFMAIGIAPEQILFADVLLLMCLLRDSPPISPREHSENDENKHRVVTRGRQPGLRLLLHNREQTLHTLAHELFDDMAPFAARLDNAYGGCHYQRAMQDLRLRIDEPARTPSAQVLEAVRRHGSYFDFAMAQAINHTRTLQAQMPDAAMLARLNDSVTVSHREHERREALPQEPFETCVAHYFSSTEQGDTRIKK